ncbi:nuclear transport factor 2 family protein [Kitasatospora sp. NPDC002551]|uniref:nuclear transport factor 2 family protein n=1 Tax=Kitasatospora sp. NPDC002551 TaxID=3154539 RepID=UPI003317DBF2
MTIDHAFAQRFAEEWVATWNSRDLEGVLAHYTDDVVFVSPRAVSVLGEPSGEVRGKDALRAYWGKALALLPGLHFTLDSVRVAVDTIVIDYRNERGVAVAEALTFRDGLVCRGFGAYGPES